jgi:hypothetical protein
MVRHDLLEKSLFTPDPTAGQSFPNHAVIAERAAGNAGQRFTFAA